RGLVSKVSLLLYLTGGRGESVLRFGDDLSLDAIDAMTAIVFAQDRPHDGGPFVDGPKIFLRTELVYRDANLEHSRSVARVFARACYLSTQSVFDPELERRADAAYDQAAAARWRMRAAAPEPEPMFRKRFRGVDFLANGYDYWFRRDAVTLPTAAAIAVLDVVNAKLGDRSFRSACRSRTLKVAPDEDMPAWVAARLKTTKRPDEPPFAGIHKPGLLPPLEQADKEDDQEIWGRESEYSLDTSDDWDPRRNRSLLWHLEKQRNRVEPIVSRAPILIMGQEVFLDPERFVIEGDKIHILSNEALAPVHFAGGIAYYDPSSFTRVVFTLDAPVLLVPPITFREHGDTLHLTLDLFRNGWMVRYSRRELEIRRLIGPDEWPTQVD
ncbi:MAG: hypothetical protein KC636_11205, partial [Myxococcales bacterium]|nr:hypothetical protein [Myxococcales bacterium]